MPDELQALSALCLFLLVNVLYILKPPTCTPVLGTMLLCGSEECVPATESTSLKAIYDALSRSDTKMEVRCATRKKYSTYA